MDRLVGRSAAEMDNMVSTLRRLDVNVPRAESKKSANGYLSAHHGSGMVPSSTQPLDRRQMVPGSQRRVASHSNLPQSPTSPNGHDTWASRRDRQDRQDQLDDEYDEQLLAYPGTPSAQSFKTVRPSSGKSRYDANTAVERRPSNATSVYSLYPPAGAPPTKGLPPVPNMPGSKASRRLSSHRGSIDAQSEANSSTDASRYSQSSSHGNSSLDQFSNTTSPHTNSYPFQSPPPISELDQPAGLPIAHGSTALDIAAWKQLTAEDKYSKAAKDKNVYFFDVTGASTTLASKHGNNVIRVWSVGSGTLQSVIKFKSLTTAQVRGRNYFVRSHAILSEPSCLIGIASGFGDSLELWDWAKNKKLQTIDKAERWAAVRSNVYESAFPALVTYRGDRDTLELWSTTPHSKKPFKLSRTINLLAAGLPVLPKYPELAFSSTGPILVAASGPRPPRPGHPPSENETLLVAWNVADQDDPNIPPDAPYQVVAPWQHPELDSALPSSLATYGSVAVSIWIPAGYRAVPVPASRGGQGYNLTPVDVRFRYVLVWDFGGSGISQTRTFRIPNAISCVSPDCRFIAYCDQAGTGLGARGNLVILDAMSGKRLWCWPDPEASDCGPKPGFQMLDSLQKVTEMSFSADGGFLFIGNSEGEVGVWEVREVAATQNVQVVPQSQEMRPGTGRSHASAGSGKNSIRRHPSQTSYNSNGNGHGFDVGPIDLSRARSRQHYPTHQQMLMQQQEE
ncbi:hypothetical protein V8F06_009550 [Rhypophila decipiens]